MTDAFEEVEEGLRRDKATELWNKIFPWLIAAFVLLLAAVGVWEFMKWQRSQEIEKAGAAYATAVAAIDADNLPAAKTALEPVAAGTGGYAALSNHILAAIEAQTTGDPAAAAPYLEKAAAAEGGLMGDLATLKLAYARADTVDLAALTALVQPLVDKGGQASALARELLAAKKLAGGDIEGARRDFQTLQLDLDAPQAMKQRVQQILFALPPAKAAAATPAPATTPAAPAAPAPAAPAPAQPNPGQPSQ